MIITSQCISKHYTVHFKSIKILFASNTSVRLQERQRNKDWLATTKKHPRPTGAGGSKQREGIYANTLTWDLQSLAFWKNKFLWL